MSEKLRVLLVAPSPKLPGGISRWTGHIMSYHQYNSCKTIIELLEIDKIYLPQKGIYGLLYRLLRGITLYTSLINRFNKKTEDRKFDLVHICSSASLGLIKDWIICHLSHKKGIKTVVHFRFGRIPQLSKSKNWEWKLLLKTIKLADTTIVIDRDSFNTLKDINLNKNIELLPNPISDNILEIVRKNSSLSINDREVVFVGQLLKTKGIYELVDACSQIPDITVKMYGAAHLEMISNLRKRAGANNQWLDIVGEIEYSEVIRKMISAAVFVLPTYTEGFPNVILECMACGSPIVACGVGAIPEMLNQGKEPQCGIIIEPRNVKQLKAGIEKMLSDREFAIECGKNAKQRVVERYSIEKIFNQMENIWKQTISNQESRSRNKFFS